MVLVMDRHDLAFLIEGIISFILIVVLSLFVSSQSANAKETEKKWKEKDCMDLYKAIILFTKLSDKEWKQKNEEKGSFYASIAADYSIIYSTFCTKWIRYSYLYILRFEYIKDYNDLKDNDQIGGECDIIKLEG